MIAFVNHSILTTLAVADVSGNPLDSDCQPFRTVSAISDIEKQRAATTHRHLANALSHHLEILLRPLTGETPGAPGDLFFAMLGRWYNWPAVLLSLHQPVGQSLP